MRIAHVLRRISFDDWGGTEQVVWNIAKAQKAAGHAVRIFATTALWGGLAAKNAENAKPLCSLRSLWLGNKQYAETVDGIEIVRFKPIYPWWPMPKSLVAELDRKGAIRSCLGSARPFATGSQTSYTAMRWPESQSCAFEPPKNLQLPTPNSQLKQSSRFMAGARTSLARRRKASRRRRAGGFRGGR